MRRVLDGILLGGAVDGDDALGAKQVGAFLHEQRAQPCVQPPPIALALDFKPHRCHPVIVLVLSILLQPSKGML